MAGVPVARRLRRDHRRRRRRVAIPRTPCRSRSRRPPGARSSSPGNFNYLVETLGFGTEPKFAAKGVKPDLDGDGKVEFGEALPDADFLRRRGARLRDERQGARRGRAQVEPDAAGRVHRARRDDADDVRVLRGVEELALHRRRQGARRRRSSSPRACRTSPTSSAGSNLIYDNVEPSIAKVDRQQASQTGASRCSACTSFAERLRERGGGRQEVHRRRTPTRSAARRRTRPRRSPGQVTQAAGQLEHQAGGLTVRCARSPSRWPSSRSRRGRRRAGERRRRRPGARPRRVQPGLFDAQTELILGGPRRGRATPCAPPARRYARRAARRRSARADPARRRRRPRRALARRRARRARRRRRRARRRARERCAPRSSRGAYAVTLAPPARGDAATARDWLLLREFRTATRFTRPGADATLAARRGCGRGRLRAARGARRPSPRTCSTPTRRACASCSTTPTRGAGARPPGAPRRGRRAGRRLLRDPRARATREDRGARPPRAPRPRFAALRDAALAGGERFAAARAAADARARRLHRRAVHRPRRPRAAPSSSCASSRSCRSSTAAASRTTRVTLDFEIQEAVAFRTGARRAFADLRDQLAKRDARAHRRGRAAALDRLGAPSSTAPTSARTASPRPSEVEAVDRPRPRTR